MGKRTYQGDLKCIQKSVRMTEKVCEYVEKQKGRGFSQKFENLILQQVEFLEDDIRKLQEEKNALEKEILQLKEVREKEIPQLKEVRDRVEKIMRNFDEIEEVIGEEKRL